MGDEMPPDLADHKVGTLRFQQPISTIPISQQIVLSPKGDLGEAAKKLFAALRDLDNRGYDYILAERFPDVGLGRAINDRLERAQHKFKTD
jgi:L-threonylcarbamoyladenylate synthase